MKTKEPNAEAQQIPAATAPARNLVPAERTKFRALVLGNPNYFGNLQNSPFPPVLNITLDKTFEQIGCVGFQPQFNRLDAVVYINQASGYGGGVCTSGTQEFVRFYLSGDNGATWQDAGVSAFSACDIPSIIAGQRPLKYVVTLQVSPAKKFCFQSNQYLVRAILSWNVPPPANTPLFRPVWGDVNDTHIQIDPQRLILIDELLQLAQVKLPPALGQVLDVKQALPLATPPKLGALALQTLYKGKDVEPLRYALPELQQLVAQPSLVDNLMASDFGGVLPELNLDLAKFVDQLYPINGNTRYEELERVGINPDQSALVGVLRVKLPNGYSGGPCTAGSLEYVSFWGDFNGNGSFSTFLGTSSVNVHDITPVPGEGLKYSVFLPVNLDKYRRPCQRGAVVVAIRAILSWQVAPPTTNPDFVPVWGNRQESFIQLKPGRVAAGNTPFIETVGSMAVADINGAGYANGPAQLAGFSARQSPFGGEIILTGHLANATDISASGAPLKYRVILNDGSGDQVLGNPFTIARTQLLDGVWSILPSIVQSTDSAGFYTYREDLTGATGNAEIFVSGNVLARWQTAGKSGTWTIRIEAKDAADTMYFGNTVTVRVDNEGPQFPLDSFKITSGSGTCGDFVIGDIIEGNYQVTDDHFSSLSLAVQPPLGAVFLAPVPDPRTYPSVPTTGETGVWRLDTSAMSKCGYTVRLVAADRTIVNSGFVGFSNEISVGLCLTEAELNAPDAPAGD
ncbi:MAG: hypothetical protein ACJ8GW_18985 [Massilia sp.]